MDWLRGLPQRFRNRRDAQRTLEPFILAYYWTGTTSLSHRLADIGMDGAYIYTNDRWYLGTIVRLSLQVDEATARDMGLSMPAASVMARCKVVRHGPDGVGMKFIFLKKEERQAMQRFLASTIPNDSMRTPAHQTAPTSGQ